MINLENGKEFWFIYWDFEKQDYVLVHKKKQGTESDSTLGDLTGTP